MAGNTKRVGERKKDSSTKVKVKKPSLYKVIMHNDDFTPMEFVVEMLQRYFAKSYEEAKELMLTVHHGGSCVVGKYPYDIAKTKQTRVMAEAMSRQYPFVLTIEPEEEA